MTKMTQRVQVMNFGYLLTSLMTQLYRSLALSPPWTCAACWLTERARFLLAQYHPRVCKWIPSTTSSRLYLTCIGCDYYRHLSVIDLRSPPCPGWYTYVAWRSISVPHQGWSLAKILSYSYFCAATGASSIVWCVCGLSLRYYRQERGYWGKYRHRLCSEWAIRGRLSAF